MELDFQGMTSGVEQLVQRRQQFIGPYVTSANNTHPIDINHLRQNTAVKQQTSTMLFG